MVNCTLKCNNYVGEQQNRPARLRDKITTLGKQKVVTTLGGVETELSGCPSIWGVHSGQKFEKRPEARKCLG